MRDTMLSLNNMNIFFTKAKKTDKQELLDLWLLCFDEKPQAAQLFFDNCFQPEISYIASDDGKIISALYLLKGSYNGLQAHYLCGAATHPEYRKKGIMGKLIEFALSDAKSRGDVYSFLFPANEGLYNFYSHFGYENKCVAYIHYTSRDEVAKVSKISDNSQVSDLLVMNEDFTGFAAKYYGIYGAKSIAENDFTAFYDVKDNTAEVFTCLCSKSNFHKLCKKLLEETKAENFVFVLQKQNNSFKNFEKIRHGMVRVLDDKYTIKNEAHIGITLN